MRAVSVEYALLISVHDLGGAERGGGPKKCLKSAVRTVGKKTTV